MLGHLSTFSQKSLGNKNQEVFPNTQITVFISTCEFSHFYPPYTPVVPLSEQLCGCQVGLNHSTSYTKEPRADLYE